MTISVNEQSSSSIRNPSCRVKGLLIMNDESWSKRPFFDPFHHRRNRLNDYSFGDGKGNKGSYPMRVNSVYNIE